MNWISKNLEELKNCFIALVFTLMFGILLTIGTKSAIYTGVYSAIPTLALAVFGYVDEPNKRNLKTALAIVIGTIIASITVFCIQYFE